jgi:2-polyprenyl-6-methoxyphenol hydroxylase-like FAD-dependent oxidoreductase
MTIDVGVIGCGTAGAAAAILLARAGCRVTVFERVAEPKPVGAGIVIQPTGQAVLAHLGLLDDVLARGAPLDRLWCRTPRGRTLVDLRYARVEPRWFGVGLHRGALFEALYRTARAEPGVTVLTGRDIRGLRRERDRTSAIDAAGAAHGPFELIVIADGAVSELRTAAGVTTRDTSYPWGALWFVADDPDRVFTAPRELYQVAVRARRLYGALPTGTGVGGDTPKVSLFWSLAVDAVDAWRAAGLAPWKDELRALDPRLDAVLDQIREPAQVLFARYRDVRMARWHDPGVVFIGDAAHATSPQLGQGANLALLDALALADAVTAGPSLAAALDAYTASRRRHLLHYQRMTRWLTPFFQSSSPSLGWLRDWLFPVANALPPIRNFMIETMAGVSRGALRRTLALPIPRVTSQLDWAHSYRR